ncbi:MAG: hypothetical protein B6245_16100 [Desulfobacteraceae bacterium 4572_88]|nr:MAG: hypothetical protein B6245_16100 [Desulfobacteraceae bacterium 4572_88]
MRKGKSGGYRVICYAESEDSEIYLLTIYAKAKNETIPVRDIRAVLKELNPDTHCLNPDFQDERISRIAVSPHLWKSFGSSAKLKSGKSLNP